MYDSFAIMEDKRNMKIKKFELQNKLIERLQAENASKDVEISVLKEQVASLCKIVDKAKDYEKEHTECLKTLYEAKKTYENATQDIMLEKMRYQAQMEQLIKDIE